MTDSGVFLFEKKHLIFSESSIYYINIKSVCAFDAAETSDRGITNKRKARMQSVQYSLSFVENTATEKGRICHYPFGTKTKVCL